MATPSSHLDEKFAGTFRKLFDTIERGGDQCSKDHLQTLLEEKCSTLALALDAFNEPSAQSRTKVTTGPSLTVDGKTIRLEQAEKDMICHLSDLLQLDELQCVTLWKSFRSENADLKVESSGDYRMSEDHSIIMRVVCYYYEDRLSRLQCVASLLRITNDDGHPFAAIALNTISTIEGKTKKTEFVDRLYSQLQRLVRQPVPSQCFTFSNWESVWAKQNLREQKSLLEILVLIYLTKHCPPSIILKFIQEFEASSFGTQQAFGYVLDKEGETLLTEVSHLCVLFAVEALALPYLKKDQGLSNDSAGANFLVDMSKEIDKIYQVTMYLGDSEEHSVFLLAWSCFLKYVNKVPGRTEVEPEAGNSNLLTSRPVTHKTSVDQGSANRQPSIKRGDNMDRIFAGRSIKLGVFDVITQILTSSLCDEDDPSNYGYRSILRGLLNTFLSETPPVCIPNVSYESLLQSVSKLYDNQADLCVAFWKEDYDKSDPHNLPNTARDRFPYSFSGLTTLLSSLSGAKAEGDDAKKPAKNVFDFLCSMETLTVMVKDTVPLSSNDHDDLVFNEQPIRVAGNDQCVRPIVIPAGTKGIRISASDERLIQWEFQYSGWHLLVAVLQGCLQMDRASTVLDVDDPEEELYGGNLKIINSILELLRKTIENNPDITHQLVKHVEEAHMDHPSQYPMQAASFAPSSSSHRPVLVSTICHILSYCCTARQCPIPTVTSTLRCLATLLPFYRNEVWSYLETAPILPRRNASFHLASRLASQSVSTDPSSQIQHIVSQVECTNGQYPLLLAFLNLVTALVRDIQHHWWSSGLTDNISVPNIMTSRKDEYKVDVLYLCLHYLMLDVFPTYASWRYKFLSERFLIGSKVLTIFSEVAQFFKGPKTLRGLTLTGLRDEILNKFLYDGGAYHISPLLDVISDGAAMANNLYHISRFHEAARAERLTEMAFTFVKLLLQRQLELVQQGNPPRESALERLMLERTKGNNSPDFLYRLMKHIHYQHSITLPTLATNVVSLLCRTLSTWKNIPNFVQYLGGTDFVPEIIRGYLEIAQDSQQNERLLASIWEMISLLLESQPTLAILFLECNDNVMPSPKSAYKLEQQKKKEAQTNANDAPASAIRGAIHILDDWQMLSEDKPTALSNVLRCLSCFWQTAFDHYAINQVTRSDGRLWQALGQILMNTGDMEVPTLDSVEFETPRTFVDEDIDSTPSLILSNQCRETRRLCCRRICKSLVMRIMSLEIHLTAGAEASSQEASSINDKLPAGLKSLLAKMTEPTKLAGLRKLFLEYSFDSNLPSRISSSAHMLMKQIGISSSSPLLQKVAEVGGSDTEADGEGRQYGDSYLYDLRLARVRVQALCDDLRVRFNGADGVDDDMTAAGVALRQVQEESDKFLADLCAANNTFSLLDAQMVLFKEFKTWIEVCSSHVEDLIWVQGNRATAMFLFMKDLIEQAKLSDARDGVALTAYEQVLSLVRSLAEDWVKASRHNMEESGALAISESSRQANTLLEMLCGLVDRENFAVMKSVRDYTAIAFHRPLLETIVFCLRTPQHHALPVHLFHVACASFEVLVHKAIAYGASSCKEDDGRAEECIKDLTVVISLLSELVGRDFFTETDWLAAFEKYKTIPTLHKLLSIGIELVVSELDSQRDSEAILISPYAENALFLMLTLSNKSWAANTLMTKGVTDLFCNNALTSTLQQGQLDAFVRFDADKANQGLDSVERNPLHVIWCQMLGVTGNIVRVRGRDDSVLRRATGFLQIYKEQIGRAFANANDVNDSLLGLTPSESLSSPVLEEMEKVTAIFFGLAKHLSRVMPYACNLLVAYKDCSLPLIQRYHYFFTHPAHLQAQLFPLGETERELAQTPTTVTSASTAASKEDGTEKTSQWMQITMQRTVLILRNTLAVLVLLTEAGTILQHKDIEWPFGNTILSPTMQIGMSESASFGTLTECVNVGLSMIKQWLPQPKQQRGVSAMLSVIQSGLTLLTTQVALWIAKPGMDDETRKEIAIDNLMDIVETLAKTKAALKKLEESMPRDSMQRKDISYVRDHLISPLQLFLTERYFQAKSDE